MKSTDFFSFPPLAKKNATEEFTVKTEFKHAIRYKMDEGNIIDFFTVSTRDLISPQGFFNIMQQRMQHGRIALR